MELVLTRQTGDQIAVDCDGQPSHTFDLLALIPNDQYKPTHPIEDPEAYGSAIYDALFPSATAARCQLENAPKRILLVTSDNELDAIPWEYVYGTYGPTDAKNAKRFLVSECCFVRGLSANQRFDPPALDTGLHIIAIPSNPLDKRLAPLNIDGEWIRLEEIIQEVPYAITLERTRPPTIEQMRRVLANRRNCVVHFMGHGGQHEIGTVLLFENDYGDLDPITAKHFMRHVRGSAFLVALNACVSATPGPTAFSNIAAALVQQKIPYALGMRFSIDDDDARNFSRIFYSELAHGVSVEEALLQARLALANSPRCWAIGVPVLYTALSSPATGFTSIAGIPIISEHRPLIDAIALPSTEGAFQGRTQELKAIGKHLTGDSRPRLLTIHGAGGQGKTALAREAVERFAYAWPGGVWAISLENLPSRAAFASGLALFLGITTQEIADSAEMERQVLARLKQRRLLLVLDNAETLVEAVEANNEEARHLAQFIREQLPNPPVSLLVTSRIQLGWPGEVLHEIGGLSPDEGAALFRQSAPGRAYELAMGLAELLSQKVDGHPLSLRLLGGAFNASAIPLQAFIQECDEQLMKAQNKYLGTEHRQRTLYASIETSVRYLNEDHRHLLGGLWLFHAPFLPETATQIFDSQAEYIEVGKKLEGKDSLIYERLDSLFRHGMLNRETLTVREVTQSFYRLPQAMRPYIEQFLASENEREALLARFGAVYARLVDFLRRELDRGGIAASTALLLREDIERGASCVTGVKQGYYWLHWGWVLQRLGYRQSGLDLTLLALEIGQAQEQGLNLQALNNLALIYQQIGQPHQALQLYEQALPLWREAGDRIGEAATLNNIAGVYNDTGQPHQALQIYQQTFSLTRVLGNRVGEAVTLNNMAGVYQQIGQLQEALRLYEQALPLMREVGDRAGEAATLSNMAIVYQQTGQLQEALRLYEQALPLRREVGDRAGEAATLNGLAYLYQEMQFYEKALAAFEQSIVLEQQVSQPAGEIAGLLGLALLLYQHMDKSQAAIDRMKQALTVFVTTDLAHDAAGHTKENVQQYLVHTIMSPFRVYVQVSQQYKTI